MKILANLLDEATGEQTPVTKVSREMFENSSKFKRSEHATMQAIHKSLSTSATKEMQRHPIDGKMNKMLQQIQEHSLKLGSEHGRYVNKPLRAKHSLYSVMPKGATNEDIS